MLLIPCLTWQTSKSPKPCNSWRTHGQMGILGHFRWEHKIRGSLCGAIWQHLSKSPLCLAYDSALPLLGLQPPHTLIPVQTHINTSRLVKEALFVVMEDWRQLKSPSVAEKSARAHSQGGFECSQPGARPCAGVGTSLACILSRKKKLPNV